MTAHDLLLILLGVFLGATGGAIFTWSQARKIEDVVPGGLRAWANYERANAQAKGAVLHNVTPLKVRHQ